MSVEVEIILFFWTIYLSLTIICFVGAMRFKDAQYVIAKKKIENQTFLDVEQYHQQQIDLLNQKQIFELLKDVYSFV